MQVATLVAAALAMAAVASARSPKIYDLEAVQIVPGGVYAPVPAVYGLGSGLQQSCPLMEIAGWYQVSLSNYKGSCKVKGPIVYVDQSTGDVRQEIMDVTGQMPFSTVEFGAQVDTRCFFNFAGYSFTLLRNNTGPNWMINVDPVSAGVAGQVVTDYFDVGVGLKGICNFRTGEDELTPDSTGSVSLYFPTGEDRIIGPVSFTQTKNGSFWMTGVMIDEFESPQNNNINDETFETLGDPIYHRKTWGAFQFSAYFSNNTMYDPLNSAAITVFGKQFLWKDQDTAAVTQDWDFNVSWAPVLNGAVLPGIQTPDTDVMQICVDGDQCTFLVKTKEVTDSIVEHSQIDAKFGGKRAQANPETDFRKRRRRRRRRRNKKKWIKKRGTPAP
jgi:hypothetical protein